MKKALSLLLCVPLALSACSSAPDKTGSSSGSSASNEAKGRYVEEAMTLPDGIGSVDSAACLADGTLVMLTDAVSDNVRTHNWSLYASEDEGKNWTKREIPLFQENKDRLFLSGSGFNAQGDLYLIYSIVTQEYFDAIDEAMKTGDMSGITEPETKLGKIAPDGSYAEIPLDGLRGEGGRVAAYDLFVTEDSLFVNQFDSIVQVDSATGEQRAKFPCQGAGSMVVYGDTLGVYDENGFHQYSLTSGDQLDDIPIDSPAGTMKAAASPDGKALIRCDSSGLYSYVLGGDVWERLVDGAASALSMPSMSVGEIAQIGEQSYWVLLTAEDSVEASIYRFDPQAPLKPEQKLTIYSLYDNDTIRQAAGLFRRTHPDYAVELTTALAEDSALTESDALRALNTELLAGKGPDVLILDGLPVASYRDKGVLADLSPVVKAMSDSGELAQNVVGAYEKGGTLPAVPARFAVPVMYGPKECIEAVSDFKSLADWITADHEKNGLRPLPLLHPAALIREFYAVCAPAWTAEDGSIKEAEFSEFLENVKKIADTSDDPDNEADADVFAGGRGEWSSFSLVFPWASVGSEEFYQLMTMPVVSTSDLNWPDAAMKVRGDTAMALLPGQAQKVFVPKVILGVNANSEHQEAAMELVRLALSEQVQGLDFFDGLPVNTGAFRELIENPFKEGDDGMQGEIIVNGESRFLQAIWPEDAVMESFMQTALGLTAPSTADPVLMQMIIDETAPYFRGEKELSAAVEATVQRTQAYLSE